ncbi:MAG: sensor histidine kinase [Planctomycetota bacterium]|jgi:PAS domain S-box-containing protein
MKKNGGKAKEFFTKLRYVYGRLIATETKSQDYSTDNEHPRIKWAGRPTNSKAPLQGRLVIKGFMLAFLFTVVILAGVVWYTWRSNRHLKALETIHFRLLQLSGQIIHIDEVLTMSAHMAVETGELEWEVRYRNFEPQLDSAIKEVIELSPEQFMKEAISRTDTANIELVAMENQAFDLIRRGDRQTAKKVLHDPEYGKQKQIYSSGIHEISNAISIRERVRIKKEQRIALTITVLLIVTIPLVAFIWFTAMRILRRYIVERKQAELALRMGEQRFRAIADYTYFWEVWVSPGGNPVWTNPAVERVTGYSADELMAMRDYPMALVYEGDREKVDKAFKSALKGSTGRGMEFRLLRKDGSIIWVETAWQPIFDEKGVSQGYRISIHDITDRKQAEEALLESEQRFRDFFENAPIGFHIFGPDRIIIDINDAELEMIGYSRKAIVGKKTWAELIVPQQRDMFKKHWHNIITKGYVRNLEYTLVHKDGHHINVIVNASARFDKDGNVVNTRGSVLNITARKQAEQARHKLTRELEAKNKELESILYAASHDLKSPLVNIQGFGYELSQSCDMIRSALTSKGKDADMEKTVDVALNEDIPNSLDFILASTSKMDSLLSSLLDMSHLNTVGTNVKAIDMNAMMVDVAVSMEYQIKQAAAKVDFDPLPPCIGDPSQINRVFSNLLTNALKFLDESRPGQIRIYGKSQDNKSIYCVEDNGIGIAPEHQEKIFQIFYQHEPDKKTGEGIGLTIVRRIIEKHDGKVWVESEVGKGSKFSVSLPST